MFLLLKVHDYIYITKRVKTLYVYCLLCVLVLIYKIILIMMFIQFDFFPNSNINIKSEYMQINQTILIFVCIHKILRILLNLYVIVCKHKYMSLMVNANKF